jgi:MarR family transcriptional regulator, transcriptional regulator for hemolysin
MNSPDPYSDLGFLIYDIARLMRSRAKDKLGQLDMTEAQWRAIAHLSRMEGCRQADLAQALEIRPITLARVIDKLEAANLVSRQPNAEDRRAFCLYLTEEAKPLVATLEQLREELRELALDSVEPRHRADLMAALAVIRENLSSHTTENWESFTLEN